MLLINRFRKWWNKQKMLGEMQTVIDEVDQWQRVPLTMYFDRFGVPISKYTAWVDILSQIGWSGIRARRAAFVHVMQVRMMELQKGE